MRRFCAAILLLCVSAANPTSAASKPEPVLTNDWRKLATQADKSRLTRTRTALLAAIASAAKDGESEAISREGSLLQADAGLDQPAIPAGQYQCRTIKLGRNGVYSKAFSVRPVSPCTLTDRDGRMRFAVTSGNQRARGNIFPGNERRQIFLGTVALGDETRTMEYGRDNTRDMAGSLERIGDRRWRLLLPEPRFDSQMDVIEITPAN
jgi:Domain of unknown function (DUF4893)